VVIKGNARGGAGALAAHLQRTDTNERAELREARGVVAEDLDGALREMEAVASGARSKRPFYHASINTRADELLTEAQWTKAIDRLERELGLTGQPRVVVAHLKEGRAHVHIAWSRIELETMKAIPDSHNYRRHEIVARELEREFGHARVQGAHIEREGEARPDRTPSHAEMQQAERSGLSPTEAKTQLTEIWNRTDSGRAFAAAIEEQGWALARGDRRDFVLIDHSGEPHSLARRIEGAKAKDIRARMADLEAAGLPSVDEAKEIQRSRQQAQADARAARTPEAEPALAHAAAENASPENAELKTEPAKEAGQGAMIEQGEVDRALAGLSKALQERDERQQEEARLQAEAERQEKTRTAEVRRTDDLARENADYQVQQIEIMREQRTRLDQFEAEQKRQAEDAKLETERKREADARGNQAEGEIRSAGDRYRVALGDHYDVRDPYASLSRAAMAEYGAFIQDRERLATQIAQEQDPDARRELELRREIEAADYMAITSRRIAGQSEIITGRRDSDEATRFRERAAEYENQSKELRQQYRDLAAERAEREVSRAETEREDGRDRAPGATRSEAAPSQSTAAREAQDQENAATRGEVTDAKAERIAQIRAQGRAFEATEKERQNSPGHDRSGRSR